MAIYKKYLELKSQGVFEETLEDIYQVGKKCNWKPIPGAFPNDVLSKKMAPPDSGPFYNSNSSSNSSDSLADEGSC